MVPLRPLYEFVRESANAEALNGRSPVGRQYSTRVTSLVKDVPEAQGFYLWGRYDARGLWRNIYLGKAGFVKKGLRSRILEELRDERCCLWRVVMTSEELKEIGGRHYPSMWHKYSAHWERSFHKAGTTHIAWVSDPALSNTDVNKIELDLIETLNPTANLSRPTPPDSLQSQTAEVIQRLRTVIHDNRKYRVSLALKEAGL
jgi:hypothetical protein